MLNWFQHLYRIIVRSTKINLMKVVAVGEVEVFKLSTSTRTRLSGFVIIGRLQDFNVIIIIVMQQFII